MTEVEKKNTAELLQRLTRLRNELEWLEYLVKCASDTSLPLPDHLRDQE